MSLFLWVCKSHEGLRDYNGDVTKTVAILYISDVGLHVHGTQLKRERKVNINGTTTQYRDWSRFKK
jgi:hypothetical protein